MKYIRSFMAVPGTSIALAILLGSCQAVDYRQQEHADLFLSREEGNQYLYRYYDPSLGYYGYMDIMGNVVINPQFDYGQEVFDGVGFVEIEGKYQFIDRAGKPLIFLADEDEPAAPVEGDQEEKPEWQQLRIEPFQMNNKGETMISALGYFYEVPSSNGGLAYIRDDKYWGLIDASRRVAAGPFSSNDLTASSRKGFCDGLFRVAKHIVDSGIPAYMDKRGQIIVECPFEESGDFQDGLAFILKNELYGYIDKQGTIAIKPRYSYASSFWKGKAVVGTRSLEELSSKELSHSEMESKRGGEQDFALIDKEGRVLKELGRIPPGWEILGDFSEGLAAVKIPTGHGFDKYGFVDSDLNLAIEPEFDGYAPEFGFVGGIIQVENKDVGLKGYIDREGRWVRSWGVGRNLTFMFNSTSAQQMAKTLDSIGAVPLESKHVFLFPDPVKTGDQAVRTWVYPGRKNSSLVIGLEDNMNLLAIDMFIKDYLRWTDFESILFGEDQSDVIGMRSTIALSVMIKYGTAAEHALNEFAIHVLKAHPGGVCDWDRNQTWTLDEVQANANSQGFPFKRRVETPTTPSKKQ